MKSFILALLAAFAVAEGAGAQNAASDSAAKSNSNSAPQAAAAQQSPELIEAGRLSVESIKLYGGGKYDEAIAAGARALQIREKALGSKDPLVAFSLANLAVVYTAKGQRQEAINLYQRALRIYENASPPDHVKASTILRNLTQLDMGRGQLAKAEDYLERAVTHLEAAFGKEHGGLIPLLFLMGELHQAQGEYGQAEPFYQRALALEGKNVGAKPDAVDHIQARYACSLWKGGHYDKAREMGKTEFETLFKRENEPNPNQPILPDQINGKALSLPAPKYSADARMARAEGQVVVGVIIDEAGNVMRACALRGHRLLLEDSEIAARQARFSRTTVAGQPVRVTGTITYNFIH